MTQIPIEILHVSPSSAAEGRAAWSDVQSALAGGIACTVLETPPRRGDTPSNTDPEFFPEAPVGDEAALRAGLSDLLIAWRHALEELMNRRWDLTDNPYARAWILPGMILVHEDPLNFPLEARSEEIAAGEPLEDPTWAILVPEPASNHARIDAHRVQDLPHADILSAALAAAAAEEGLDGLPNLSWEMRRCEVTAILGA